MENNNLNLGIIGKYHNTLAGGPSISSSSLLLSSFFLSHANPHVGQTFNASNSSLYNTLSLGHMHVSFCTPNPSDIIFSSPCNYD